MLERVVDEIEADQPEQARVPETSRPGAILQAMPDAALGGELLERGRRLGDETGEIQPLADDRCLPTRLLPGEGEQTLHDPLQAVDLLQVPAQQRLILLDRARAAQRDFEAGAQDGERIADLVRGVGGEAAHRLARSPPAG